MEAARKVYAHSFHPQDERRVTTQSSVRTAAAFLRDRNSSFVSRG